jgi:TonB family protein
MTQPINRFQSVLPGPARSKRARRIFLTVSAIAHVGFAVGFVLVGMWRVERLSDDRADTSLAVFSPPPGNSGGGAAPKAAAAVQKKPQRKVVKSLTQPTLKPDLHVTTEPVVDEPPGDGGGGDGKGTGTPTSGAGCTQEPCGVGEPPVAPPIVLPPEPQVTPPTVIAPTIVAPSIVAGLRISGETQIEPPNLVRTAIARDGASRVVGTFKMCLNQQGEVSSVTTLRSTKYAGYDDEIKSTMRNWRYRPYLIGGTAAPVCSVVTFQYVQ